MQVFMIVSGIHGNVLTVFPIRLNICRLNVFLLAKLCMSKKLGVPNTHVPNGHQTYNLSRSMLQFYNLCV